MRDSVVLDSSVIVPVFFPEERTELVMEMLKEKRFITVDLAIAEVTNVAWKRCMFFHEDKEITKEALNNCITFITDICDVLHMRDLISDAFLDATKYSITVYDALFLAAAQKRTIPLLTMDAKLYHKLRSTEDVVLIS
ncbi:MAG: type II toxin-antitoxin system VapC family toxin [Methanoregula sp.]|nr:type II toxin-antitoxin system VapC family toxin [Methanoregula sp.]MDD5189354.1 type II toxin-antitoxin system VapC family toxin [Methanoregula sp.]